MEQSAQAHGPTARGDDQECDRKRSDERPERRDRVAGHPFGFAPVTMEVWDDDEQLVKEEEQK